MSRILYVSEAYTIHDRRFLQKIAELPHEVYFLPCRSNPAALERRPVPDRVHRLEPLLTGKVSWGPMDYANAVLEFRRRLRDIKPDLVHAGPVQKGAFIAALCGARPLIVMSWGSDMTSFAERSWWMRWMTRFTLNRAEMVFGDCQAVRDKVLTFAPLRKEQIVIFPWGIDLRHFKRRPSTLRLREKSGWQTNKIVLSTRSFEPVYGSMVFLKAVRHVLERRSDVRVVMLGEGSLRPQMEEFIRDHKLETFISLPGLVSNDVLPDYFNEADVYVSSTLSDGTSISLLEAMACGLPAVVTDVAANREWVEPRKNGWLYPPGDSDGLAASILEALADDGVRETVRQSNMALAQDRADWEKNSQKMLNAYTGLLRAGRENASIQN